MNREYPLQFDLGIPIATICDWYVTRHELPYTGQQFYEACEQAGAEDAFAHVVELFYAELRAMDARLSVDPRFNFSIDLQAVLKLDQVISFFRNSNPTDKDPDIEQLSVLFRTTLAKVRDYDDALRGLTISTTRSEIATEDTDSPAAALPEQPQVPPANPAAPQGPTMGFSGAPRPAAPGAPPPNVIPGTAPPTQAPPSSVPGTAPPAHAPSSDQFKPPPSRAPVPGAAPAAMSEDEVVRAMSPKDSGAKPPGGGPPLQKPTTAPPGAPPVAGGFAPPGGPPAPGSQPGATGAAPGGPPGGPPPVDPNQQGGAPKIGPGGPPPAADQAPPPSTPPGAPPPPNPEF